MLPARGMLPCSPLLADVKLCIFLKIFLQKCADDLLVMVVPMRALLCIRSMRAVCFSLLLGRLRLLVFSRRMARLLIFISFLGARGLVVLFPFCRVIALCVPVAFSLFLALRAYPVTLFYLGHRLLRGGDSRAACRRKRA